MSLTAASNYTKDVWLPQLVHQLENSKDTFFGILGKSTMNAERVVEGRKTYVSLRVGDSKGQGNIREGGDFPAPGDPDYKRAELSCARIAHTSVYTSHEIALLNGTRAAAAPVIAEKMMTAKDAMTRDIERQALGDGTGVIAKVASSSGSTVTLQTTGQTGRDRFIFLDEPNRATYAIVDPSDGSDQVSGAFRVSAINETTNVLTCVDTAGSSKTMTAAANNDLLVMQGDWGVGGAFDSLEFAGLKAMIADDNTYLGINRTTGGNEFWRSIVDDNSGTTRSITDLDVFRLMNKMARRQGTQPKGNDYVAIASPGTYQAYHSLLIPSLRYTLSEVPDIGWGQPLNFNGIRLYNHIHAPRNQVNVIKKESVKFIKPRYEGNVAGDLLQFIPGHDGIFFQATAASGQGYADAKYTYLAGFLGMYTERPRDHGKLDDITEVAGAY